MTEPTPKADLELVYKASFALSALDLLIATGMAAKGSLQFLFFFGLAVFMWAYGIWIRSKANEIGD